MNEVRLKTERVTTTRERGSTGLSYATVHVQTLALLVFAFVLPQIGHAATFTVNSTNDAVDDIPGDGLCVTTAGTCTLRAAIEESNALPGFPPEEINLPSGTYVLTEGRLEIRSSLSITGDGADATIIDGNNRSSIFLISNPGTNPIINISGVTIRNAQGSIGFGTGIFVNKGSSLTLSDSVVSENKSRVGGVGISNAGFLTLFRSTVRDNQITGGGGGLTGTGAGIFNTGSADVIESTISNNQGIRGGGIANSGRLDITNSTISGNKASVGGGILNSGVVNIGFSTITGNMSGLVTGEPLGNRVGGGIANFSGQVNIGNTILAGNTDGRTPSDPLFSPDCFSVEAFRFTSFRGNLVGVVNANCDLRDTIFGEDFSFDMVGSNDSPLDPLLEPLADNGGPTQTHALQSSSAAIDEGTGVTSARFFDCPDTDQRSFIRPVDGDTDGTADCDVGAFEFGARPPPSVTCADLPLTTSCTVNGVTDQLCQGTSGPDTIVGTNDRDVIHGLAGEDIIEGRRGGDTICGGPNDDRLFGQRGDDLLKGGLHTDRCDGGSGQDTDGGCETRISIP